jgi:hypothetical protein
MWTSGPTSEVTAVQVVADGLTTNSYNTEVTAYDGFITINKRMRSNGVGGISSLSVIINRVKTVTFYKYIVFLSTCFTQEKWKCSL